MVAPVIVLPVRGQSDLFDRGTSVVVPSAPNLTASSGDGKNILSWNNVANATGYKIYWSTSSPVSFLSNVIDIDGGSTLEYEHTGLTNGTTIYYAISAVGPWGLTALSTEKSATPAAQVLSTSFTGTEYATFGDNHNFENATQWSLSMWVRPNNLAAQRCLWSKTSNDANVFGWGIYHRTDGKLLLQMRASGQLRSHITTDVSFAALTWVHFVMTYDGSQNINGCKFYFDATEDSGGSPSSGTVTNTLLTTDPSQIARRGSSFNFSGHIDEVSFWDKALSASEISEIYNSGAPTDLSGHSAAGNRLHWYKMGDGDTAPTLTDNVGSVDGTLVNDPDFETEVPS